jgi:hypothetical protein
MMVRVPCLIPVAVGVNVTEIVQLAVDAIGALQLFVSAKSPVAWVPLIVRGKAPVFVTVTVCALLAAPTDWESNVNDAVLIDADAGDATMVKLNGDDSPPPGAGFATPTNATPGWAMSAAVILAVSCVPLTKLVALALPFHCTEEPLTKLDPVTLSVKLGPPDVAFVAPSELSTGAGFWPAVAPEMLLRTKIN